ncbi:MAG: tRNA (guanosine(46)-N7)-methyltransferase TrmB [Candidatus Caccosoma sp.]|nr:tRNA (guanosine(46)-N7)-methyltransferase TrmB [Candidatus Caccosoma sp.]
MRGRNKPWANDFILAHQELIFNKDEKINMPKTLEVGIGKGDFIIKNAIANKEYLHIGVELNTSIYAIAMKKIVNEGLTNIRLLNVKALDLLNYIDEKSIDKLYLNFSDPWPQNGYRKRRLVHPLHLEIFEKLLIDGGTILFKTDNLPLFEMAVKNFNVRNYEILFVSYDYQTVSGDFVSEYEAKFRTNGDKIYRIVAKINKNSLKPWGEAIK